jgi:hypothetical protein
VLWCVSFFPPISLALSPSEKVPWWLGRCALLLSDYVDNGGSCVVCSTLSTCFYVKFEVIILVDLHVST